MRNAVLLRSGDSVLGTQAACDEDGVIQGRPKPSMARDANRTSLNHKHGRDCPENGAGTLPMCEQCFPMRPETCVGGYSYGLFQGPYGDPRHRQAGDSRHAWVKRRPADEMESLANLKTRTGRPHPELDTHTTEPVSSASAPSPLRTRTRSAHLGTRQGASSSSRPLLAGLGALARQRLSGAVLDTSCEDSVVVGISPVPHQASKLEAPRRLNKTPSLLHRLLWEVA